MTPYSVTYDGSPHTATVSTITGMCGETGATVGTVTLSTTHTNAGTYSSDTWSFTGTANYNDIATTTITDTINQANATVTADNKMKTYGDPNPSFTATVVGEVVGGDTINYTLSTSATQFSGVGNYAIVVNLGSNPNYNVTATNGTLTIDPKNASVTANSTNKTYGDANPTLTATVVGQVVGGDTINCTLSTTAVQCSNVGPYAITVTLGSNPNYNVTPTNGTLTITKKHLTVKADDKSKAWDGNPFIAFTVTITGFTCGDTVAVVSGSATYTGTAVGATLPGTYAITPQQGTLSATNYDFTTFNPGTLTIGYGTCTGQNPGGVILQPINANGSSVFKVGSTVPVKFTVCDANGNPISDPMVVFGNSTGSITLLSAVRGTVDNVNETMDNDIPDVAFRYSSGIWIFNMASNNLTKNTTYTYHINLKYGTINFTFGTK